ncbi:RING-H2 finger protein ATL20-like [Humulus lupulus]|uniref:RING-H2 finger protein ATL20-like n=1 Tax=Humulus lupulus TaxID=3486 RepID=UPI002B401681|nr:RING-H2 finger protein ATL20-like [Humulus lupulus]
MSHFSKILSFSLYSIVINLFMFTTEITSSESSTCTRKNCSPTGLTIRFPFQISDGHDRPYFNLQNSPRCGYPGFELSCRNNTSDAILSLPAGDFAVRMIFYGAQVLTIDDPDNCLPRRFLDTKFTVSGTPFRVRNLGSFTFLNCSSAPETGNGNGVEPVIVPCLSGSGYTVVAMPEIFASVFLSTPSCSVVSTAALVPVTSSEKWWEGDWGFYLRASVGLTWREPDCGQCEKLGGECGFVSGGDLEIGCSHLPTKHGLSKGVQYIFYFITFLGILGFLYFNCRPKCHNQETNTRIFRHIHWRNNNQHNHQLPNTNTSTSTTILPRHNEVNIGGLPPVGIDKTIIEMYPKRLIGESRRHIKSDYNSCSICLTEYQPNDTVRTLPNCFHYFHSDCIDEWLRLNASCPICRNSPLISPSPLPTQ